VEDFWSFYQPIAKPSQVFLHDQTQNERGPQRGGRTLSKTKLKGDRTVDSFCMFRKGIEPKVRERRQTRLGRGGGTRGGAREGKKRGQMGEK
jgi:hypothetical protein